MLDYISLSEFIVFVEMLSTTESSDNDNIVIIVTIVMAVVIVITGSIVNIIIWRRYRGKYANAFTTGS
jgi:hypothetical protein